MEVQMENISSQFAADMREKGIDIELSLSILDKYNAGYFDSMKPVIATGLPNIDGKTVIAIDSESRKHLHYEMPIEFARERLTRAGLSLPDSVSIDEGKARFDSQTLRDIGKALLPRTAYGVLNGGSATSYADKKKNAAFGPDVTSALSSGFEALAPLCKGRSKGLTPAYLNPDGTPGFSFLELKMRARLLAIKEWLSGHTVEMGDAGIKLLKVAGDRFMPLFQMTSVYNHKELADAWETLARSDALAPLAAELNLEPAVWRSGIQPMISAFTHSIEGRPKRLFDKAYGCPNSALALPGGHGQNFLILKSVYESLLADGIKFAYIGNVDNIGYVPDPLAIALLTLSGKPAAFEFSRRTAVDVKGGILVETKDGRTVADIGPAIAWDRVLELERDGTPVLFNCATGLFDLEWLVPRLEDIASQLPTRFTDQDKDTGKYSQAEQVTWEVTGILPDFLSLVVEKQERFIAAKLLAETLMNSGVAMDILPPELSTTSKTLLAGQARILSRVCGLTLENGRWMA